MLGGWLSLSPPQKLGAPIFSQPHREKGGKPQPSTRPVHREHPGSRRPVTAEMIRRQPANSRFPHSGSQLADFVQKALDSSSLFIGSRADRHLMSVTAMLLRDPKGGPIEARDAPNSESKTGLRLNEHEVHPCCRFSGRVNAHHGHSASQRRECMHRSGQDASEGTRQGTCSGHCKATPCEAGRNFAIASIRRLEHPLRFHGRSRRCVRLLLR